MRFWFSLNRAARTDEERILMARSFLQESAIYIVYGILLAAIIIGGWQWWIWNDKKIDHEVAAAYFEHLSIKRELERDLDRGLSYDELDTNKTDEMNQIVNRFKTDYQETAYAALTLMNQSDWLVKAGRLEEAAELLQWIVDHPVQLAIHSLSAARLARVLIEVGEPGKALALLDSLNPSKAMATIFEEIRGDAYYSMKEYRQALFSYREAYSLSLKKPLFLQMKLLELGEYIPRTQSKELEK